MKINGSIECMLDAVDIEQAQLRTRYSTRSTHILKLIDAAMHKEEMASMHRRCLKLNHTFVYENAEHLGSDNWRVVFRIQPKTENEKIAEECGL